MSGLGAKQQLHTSHGSNSSKQSPKNNTFQGRKKSRCAPYTETKILNLTNIITYYNWTLLHFCPSPPPPPPDLLLLVTHHEETRLNTSHSPNPNPKGGMTVQ